MAEQGGSSSKGFAKTFSKKVFRTKEKVLQNLGKADKTTDDEFDRFVADFQRQQHVANKLQKELKNYIAQVKNMAHATKALYETMRDTYEPEWTGYGNLIETVEAVNSLWEAYLCDLQDRVQNPMNSYIQRFPDVRSKISKRGRKLVDFDSARHNLDTQVSAKKRDEAKISKAREELTEARHIYKTMNEELHRELPVLYEGRVTVITSNFSSLFSAEAKFEEESAKLKNEMAEITEKLAKESQESFFAAASTRPLVDNSFGLDELSLELPRSTRKPRHSLQVESLHIPSALSLSPRRASTQVDHLYVTPSFGSGSSRRSSTASSSRRSSTSFSETPYYPNSITLTQPRRCSVQVENMSLPPSLSLSPRPSLTPATFDPFTMDSFSESLRGSLNIEMNSGEVSPGLSKLYNIPTPNEVSNDKGSSKSSPRTPRSSHSRKSSTSSNPTVPPKAFHDTDEDEDEILAVPKQRVSNGDMHGEGRPDGKRAEGDGKPEEKKLEEAIALHDPMYETVDIGAQLQEGEATDKPKVKEEDVVGQDSESGGVYSVAGDTDDIYKVPVSNEPVPKSEGTLYQVQATHAYGGEDYDELTFDAGDIINVIPFEDPDEQDEGWLMGFRVGSSSKGVFPANFTKRI